MISDKKKTALHVAHMATELTTPGFWPLFGRWTIAELEALTRRSIRAWAYSLAYPGDPVGVRLIARGLAWNDVVARPSRNVTITPVGECACVTPAQHCPACVSAAGVVADGLAADGFPF